LPQVTRFDSGQEPLEDAVLKKDPQRLSKADQKALDTCPVWLSKVLACPACAAECVRSPSGYMVCRKTPAHTGLLPKLLVHEQVKAAFEATPGSEQGPVKKPDAAVRFAWRVLRARFKKLVALFEDAPKS